MTRTLILFLISTMFSLRLKGQPNCNYYHLLGDSLCFQACELATNASMRQGSRESQEQFDRAISLCPKLAFAYFEKAVPYLKRGQLTVWKTLIDKAVELDPVLYLGYRGW